MHTFTFTNQTGVKRVVELPASQIAHVIALCKSLQAKKISYKHTFLD